MLQMTCLILLAAVAVQCGSPMHPIVVGGNMLFDTVTSERFFVKGMTYGYEVEDNYEHFWKPAVDKIAAIGGVNTVRIYNVNPPINVSGFPPVNASYDNFLQYMQQKGLYVVVPLTPPGIAPWNYCVLNRAGLPPLNSTSTCYPSCLLTYAQAVINQFSKYTNVLTYIIGNEVMNGDDTWKAAPCIKAFARDIKAYMHGCKSSLRPVPLTYSAADTDSPKHGLSSDAMNALKAQYLSCDAPSSIDMMGLNIYRWCSDMDTFEKVYSKLQDHMSELSIPVIMTEFDCANFRYQSLNNQLGQRDWKNLLALLGEEMSPVFSGGTAYAYGVTGGTTFAMYNGGGVTPKGSPGYNKSCGFPDGVCGVDNFAAALANATCPQTAPEGANVCVWQPEGYNRTVPTCPAASQLPAVLDPVPATRQGAPGYTPVTCPAHTLSPSERVVNNCEAPAPYNPDGPAAANFWKGDTFKIICAGGGAVILIGVMFACCKRKKAGTMGEGAGSYNTF